MPSFDPKGGFSGPVSTYQQPGWAPVFKEREKEEAERDEAERRKYLERESMREAQRFHVRRPAQPPPFQPRMPSGAIDEDKLAGIVAAINALGLHIDRSKLIEHAKTKFGELAQLGRDCRLVVSLSVELTDFRALSAWMSNLFPSPLPPLGLTEQLRGEKLPAAALIKGLDDIWKCPPDPLLHKIYAHWRAFKPLVFAQSLLDAADAQNVIRSPFWSSGLDRENSRDQRLELLRDWQGFIVPPSGETFIVIKFDDLLLSVIAWLSDDPALAQAAADPPAFFGELARELTNLRSSGERDVTRAHRLTEAFVLGLDAGSDKDKPALASWDYLGGLERDHTRVRHLLTPIVRRFPLTAAWHAEALSANMIAQPTRYDGATYEFDACGFRDCLDTAIYGAILYARSVTALCVAQELHGETSQLAAVIGNRLIVTTAAKGIIKSQLVAKLDEAVKEALALSFPGLSAKVNVTVEDSL